MLISSRENRTYIYLHIVFRNERIILISFLINLLAFSNQSLIEDTTFWYIDLYIVIRYGYVF